MGTIVSQISSLSIVYSAVYTGADQRKHQSSASLAFLRGIHRWPVNSPHKWPVTRKMTFPFDDVIMRYFALPTQMNTLWILCTQYHNLRHAIDIKSVHPLSPDKMADISRTTFSDAFSSMIIFVFCLKSPTFVLNGHIDNKSALDLVMAWRRTDDKPLPEPMLTQFPDAYTPHLGTWERLLGSICSYH